MRLCKSRDFLYEAYFIGGFCIHATLFPAFTLPKPMIIPTSYSKPHNSSIKLTESLIRTYFHSGFCSKKVKFYLWLTNYALRHEDVWGSEFKDTYFLDLGTSWRWVVSFTPRTLYTPGKSLRYPLDRRFGGPQSRSVRFGEEKILTPTGTRTPTSRSSSPPPVAIPTALSQLTSSTELRVTIFWYLTPCDLVAEVCGFLGHKTRS
jgi:hypothetical protein